MPPPPDMAFWLGRKYAILGKTAEGEYQRNVAEAGRSRAETEQVAPNAASMRALQAAQSGLYGEEATDLRVGRYPSDAVLGQIHDRLFGPQSGQQQQQQPVDQGPQQARPGTVPITIQRGLGGPVQTYQVPKYDPLLDTTRPLQDVRPQAGPGIIPRSLGGGSVPGYSGSGGGLLDSQGLRKGSANVKAKGGKSGGKSGGKGGGSPQGLEQILPALMAASQASQMGGGAVGPQAADGSPPSMAPGAAAPATQPPGMRRGMTNVMGYQAGSEDISGDTDPFAADKLRQRVQNITTGPLMPLPSMTGPLTPTATMPSLTQTPPGWHPPMALPPVTQPQATLPGSTGGRGPAGVDRYESREHYAILPPEQMRQIHSILYDDPMRMVNLPGGATAKPGAAPGDIWYPAPTTPPAAAPQPTSVPLPPPRPTTAPPGMARGRSDVKAPAKKGNGKENGKAKSKAPAKPSGDLHRGLAAILPQLLAAAQQGGGGPPGGPPMAPGGPAPPAPQPTGMAMGSMNVGPLMDPRSAHSAPGYPFGAGYLFGATAVPGQGSGTVDKVPAMLAPHEAVLNRAAADMMGRGKIAALNAAGAQQMGLRRGAR